jgi:hypothetical protein
MTTVSREHRRLQQERRALLRKDFFTKGDELRCKEIMEILSPKKTDEQIMAEARQILGDLWHK